MREVLPSFKWQQSSLRNIEVHSSGIDEFEVVDQPDVENIVPNPMLASLPEELISDYLESLNEIEVDVRLQPYLEEDRDCPPA